MHRVRGLLQQSSHHRHGRGNASLGQRKQGSPGLRVAPERVRLVEGRLRAGMVALRSQHLAPLVEREPCRGRAALRDVPREGQLELVESLGQCPTRPHDLGAVHRTLPRERHELRLRLAPPRQQGRPLGHPPVVGDLLAPLHHRAVGVAGDDRRDVRIGEADHGLVEEGQSLPNPSAVDEYPPLARQAQRDEVCLPAPPSGLRDALGELERGGELTREDVPEHLVHRLVAVLDRIRRCILQQPGAPGHPAPADRRVPGGVVEHPEPEGVARGGQGRPRVDVVAVRLLVGTVCGLAVAGEEGRGREGDPVLFRERVGVQGGQALVRRGPRTLLEGLPPERELREHVHRASLSLAPEGTRAGDARRRSCGGRPVTRGALPGQPTACRAGRPTAAPRVAMTLATCSASRPTPWMIMDAAAYWNWMPQK